MNFKILVFLGHHLPTSFMMLHRFAEYVYRVVVGLFVVYAIIFRYIRNGFILNGPFPFSGFYCFLCMLISSI